MHKRIIAMIEKLTDCLEPQFDDLHEADCCELGQAVDILKDLEEALYYHTVTEAMKGEGAYGDWPEEYNKKKDHHEDGQVIVHKENIHEGRSYKNRRMYMESKQTKDKATQLRELEKYMQELTSDMVEMIEDASPEEKQYLEKKISALASKIGQMK